MTVLRGLSLAATWSREDVDVLTVDHVLGDINVSSVGMICVSTFFWKLIQTTTARLSPFFEVLTIVNNLLKIFLKSLSSF